MTDEEAVEKIRKIVREELDKTTFELPTHTHDLPGAKEKKEEAKPEEDSTESPAGEKLTCDDCGTKVTKDSKFCKSCGGELDWETED